MLIFVKFSGCHKGAVKELHVAPEPQVADPWSTPMWVTLGVTAELLTQFLPHLQCACLFDYLKLFILVSSTEGMKIDTDMAFGGKRLL